MKVILLIVLLVFLLLIICSCNTMDTFSNINKVDVVYTWVSGKDPEFNKKRKDLGDRIEHFIPEAISLVPTFLNYTMYNSKTSCNRMSNMDEIIYSIKSIEKFAPWVNNIYIILPKPHFKLFPVKKLKNRKLILIAQEDLLNNDLGNFNPSYNSNAIELCLDYIPGLSNKFLYLNDDVIVTKPIKFADLYKDNKTMIIYQKFMGLKISSYLSSSITEMLTFGKEKSSLARYNSNTKLNKLDTPQKHNDLLISHAPIIIDKEIYKDLKLKLKSDVIKTLNNRFRSSTDLVFPHYIYPHYLSTIDKTFTSKLTIEEVKWSDYEFINSLVLDQLNNSITFLLLNDEKTDCSGDNKLLIQFLNQLITN